MAMYHFSGSVISRGQGKSSVVSAAYRSGEKLFDERQERSADYTRKQDVIHKEIMLPEGAPEQLSDRQILWNAVEMAENRKDAQLAREFNFSLPRELDKEQGIELAREFVQNEFVANGMIADLCIHEGKTKDGEEQPHAHVMLTMREVTEEGFGLKERGWNAKENLLLWREAWAEHANKHLAMNGIDQRIDHRTLEEQGIGLTPQKKIGPKVFRIYDTRVENHQQIAKENGDKLLEDPTIALNAITRQQSTFTQRDLARFVNRHTIDAEQFQVVYEKVKASEQIIALSSDDRGTERFTTKEMLSLESKMLDDAIALKDSSSINLRSAGRNHNLGDTSFASLSSQQKEALEHVIENGDIKCLVGYAGTGKSRLLAQAKEIWEKNGYRVHGATLSGIAAENLEGASGIESRTLASRSYYWDKGEEKLTKKDILVIDEAGMLGSRQIAKVLEEVKSAGAKTVLIGDPQQLQAIEAGAAFRAVSEQTGHFELTEIKRQQEPWQQQATKEFALRNTESAIAGYEEHGRVHLFKTQAVAKQALVEAWNERRISYPLNSQIMLAYTRKDAEKLNEMARDLKKENYEFVGDQQELQTSGGSKQFATGDRIYFLKNDRGLGVKNGTLGTIEKFDGDKVTVTLDKEDKSGNSKTVTFNLKQYDHITHGYAATIHKAQGVTVDNSYILASKHLDSHAIYVGMSRHRESADLFWSKEEFANKRELEQVLNRDRSKDVTLDYLNSPSQERAQDQYTGPSITRDDIRNYQKELKRDRAKAEGRIIREETREVRGGKGTEQRGEERSHEPQERRAERLVDKYYEIQEKYHQIKEQGRSRSTEVLAKGQLDRSARDIYKDKNTMDYLQKSDRDLFKEMSTMKERDRIREKERDFELSR